MEIEILSLFPDYFRGPFDVSMIKSAQERGILQLRLVDIRDFAEGRHRRVDDRPYGGGPGMVMMAEPLSRALSASLRPHSHVVYLSPQGTPLSDAKSRELASHSHLILVSGHYEGVDERFLGEVDEEISIGDVVLSNGCAAAIVLVDAVMRWLPGALGDEQSVLNDSFGEGLLDHPHYTRPVSWRGEEVPSVLLSGDHGAIATFRRQKAQESTKKRRPDLYLRYLAMQMKESEGSLVAVSDLGKVRAFYRRLLGWPMEGNVLEVGGVRLLFVEGQPTSSVFAIRLDTLSQLRERLQKAGVEYTMEAGSLLFSDQEGISWIIKGEKNGTECIDGRVREGAVEE